MQALAKLWPLALAWAADILDVPPTVEELPPVPELPCLGHQREEGGLAQQSEVQHYYIGDGGDEHYGISIDPLVAFDGDEEPGNGNITNSVATTGGL